MVESRKRLKILVVEDDDADRMVIRALVRNSDLRADLEEATDLATGVRLLGEGGFDCALIDHRLPDGDSFALVGSDDPDSAPYDVPVVILTGVESENLGIELVKAGAQDFLYKDTMDSTRLARAVRYAIQRKAREREERRVRGRRQQLEQLEAVASISGGIAHQFNNLLMMVIGLGEMVLEGLPAGSAERSDMEDLMDAAHRGSTLTQQLLALSRAGMSQPQTLAPNTVLMSLRPLLADTVGDRIDVQMNLTPSLSSIRIDPVHLERLMVNLALNAADAMPSGGTLAISTRPLELRGGADGGWASLERGSYVEICVTDDGEGMSPEVRRRCFEPFFTTRAPGAGLGLTIVQGIAKRNAGDVRVLPALGRGVQVLVALPARAEGSSPGKKLLIERDDGSRRTVLLVDQEGGVRRLTARMLRRHGYEVIEASNGADALDIATDRLPDGLDLLVTDTVLPGLGGVELAQAVGDRAPDLPVIVLSGHLETATMSHVADRPNVAFLRKPFTADRLMEALGRLMPSEELP